MIRKSPGHVPFGGNLSHIMSKCDSPVVNETNEKQKCLVRGQRLEICGKLEICGEQLCSLGDHGFVGLSYSDLSHTRDVPDVFWRFLVFGSLRRHVDSCCSHRDRTSSWHKKSPKDIGDIAGVAEVTIRQSYKAMIPKAAQLFPADFKFATNLESLPPN